MGSCEPQRVFLYPRGSLGTAPQISLTFRTSTIPPGPLVEPDGIEPMARPRPLGGARRDRTDDLMLAKHALSQLSYGPLRSWPPHDDLKMVGLGRLERPTSPLSGVRSNHLSYRPDPQNTKGVPGPEPRARARHPITHCPDEKRETKTAASRKVGPDWPLCPK